MKKISLLLLSALGFIYLGQPVAQAGKTKTFLKEQVEKLKSMAPIQMTISPLKMNGQTFWVRETSGDIPKVDFVKLITAQFSLMDFGAVKSVNISLKKIFDTQEEAENLIKNPILPKIPLEANLLNTVLNIGETFTFTTEFDLNGNFKTPKLMGLIPAGVHVGKNLKGQFQVIIRKVSETQIELFLIQRHNNGFSFASHVGTALDSKAVSFNVGRINLVEFLPQPFSSHKGSMNFHTTSKGYKIDLGSRNGRLFYDSLMLSLVQGDLLQSIDLKATSLEKLEKKAKNSVAVKQVDLGVQSGKEKSKDRSWALTYVNKESLSIRRENTVLRFRDKAGEIKNFASNEVVHDIKTKKFLGFLATHSKTISATALAALDSQREIQQVTGYDFGLSFNSLGEQNAEYQNWKLRLENFLPMAGVNEIQSWDWNDHVKKINPSVSASMIMTAEQHTELSLQLAGLNKYMRSQFFENSILSFLENRQWPQINKMRACWAKICSYITGEEKAQVDLYKSQIKDLSELLATWFDPSQTEAEKFVNFENVAKEKLFSVIGPAVLDDIMTKSKIANLEAKVTFRHQDESNKYSEKTWGQKISKTFPLKSEQEKTAAYFDFYRGKNSHYSNPLPSALRCPRVFNSNL